VKKYWFLHGVVSAISIFATVCAIGQNSIAGAALSALSGKGTPTSDISDSSAVSAGKQAPAAVSSNIDLSDSCSVDLLLGMSYVRIVDSQREMTAQEIYNASGRIISNSIPIRNHYFLLDGKKLELPMNDAFAGMPQNYTQDRYVPNITLEHIIPAGSLYGLEPQHLNEGNPDFSQTTYDFVKSSVIASADWNRLLPYYEMDFEDLDQADIKFLGAKIGIKSLDGRETTGARLNFIKYAQRAAKKAAMREQFEGTDFVGMSPLAYFVFPVSYDRATKVVDLAVGIIDLNPSGVYR